jgi:glutamate carboxypeptidase
MIQSIVQKVADTSYIEGTTCELLLESSRVAMELTDKNIELLEKVNEIFENVNLPTLTRRKSNAGSDASYTTYHGIPTLDSLGVEFRNIHSKNEHTLIPTLAESAKRLAAICCCI